MFLPYKKIDILNKVNKKNEKNSFLHIVWFWFHFNPPPSQPIRRI